MDIRPNLSLIAALSENGVIGCGNRLPWHLPADLANFKRRTLGKPILMGRRTWESLPGLLPHRTHVVITRDQAYQAAGAKVVHSFEQALVLVGDSEEIMVIGGAQIYAIALPLAARLYLTYIHEQFVGDAHFPDFVQAEWCECSRERHMPHGRNRYAYSFVTLERCATAAS